MNRNEARHSKITLTKSVIKQISSFFLKEENTRGVDPRTPIGEIARHAFLHWERVNAKEFIMTERINSLEKENKRLKSQLFFKTDEAEHYEKQARLFIDKYIELEKQLRKQKRKRCLAMARACHLTIPLRLFPDKEYILKWAKRGNKWIDFADKLKE
jgi:hypothetical protein